MKRTKGKKDSEFAVRRNKDTERKSSKDAETKRIS